MDYYNKIKKELINNEVYKKVKDYSKNKSDLNTYYEVGKLIVEAQGGEARAKYGDGLIKEYSKRLMKEVDKKFGYRNLMYMRKFYLLFKDEKVNAMRSQLSWTHFRELLRLNDINEINYYIDISVKQNLSYRALHDKIKSNEYKRLDDKTKYKLIKKEESSIGDFIKNSVIIKNTLGIEEISEKVLQLLILENISDFLKELGPGFCFIDNEYKIKLGDRYNYIDLLLYNIEFNCYVVVELKVTELKKEHIGQIGVYMKYIDENVRKFSQGDTIGIIICKKDNSFVIEYTSNANVLRTVYKVK